MRQGWPVLIGYCVVAFTNALGFGLYTQNLDIYAQKYNTTQTALSNSFYIGLIVQVLFCFPAIKVIQWRFDFSIISCAYLTACAYWIQYLYHPNIYAIIVVLTLNSIAQLLVLPSISFLAQLWFPLQTRFLIYGLGFYAGLLGYGLSGTISTLLSYPKTNVTVESITFSLAIVASVSFILSPKTTMQKKMPVSFKKDMKELLFDKKYKGYLIIIVAVILSVDWTFLTQLSSLQQSFSDSNPFSTTAFNFSWIVSGGVTGLLLSYYVQRKITKSGKYRDYDIACKLILFVGFISCAILGILYQFGKKYYVLYQVLVILVGIGHVGFYGLAFLSLVESLYPTPNLLISTLIQLFTSLYAIIIVAASTNFPQVNAFLTMTIISIFPLIFYILVSETNFTRYELYFNEKQARFELLKVQDWLSQLNQ